MEKPLVLITGASGFIGSHLARALAPEWRLRCLARPESTAKVPRHPNIETVAADLRDERALRGACEGVQIVVHAGALLRTASPSDIEAVNVGSTRVLADEYRRKGMEYFVYLSSENALRTDLTDAYPESKRRAEACVRGLDRHLILRPCFVFGPGDSHGLGRLVDLVKRYPVVPLFGGLKARVQPIYVDDFVRMLETALTERIEGEYTIAGSEAMTLNEIAALISQVQGLRRWLLPVPRFFWRLAAAAASRIPGAGWGPAQCANIYDARYRDPEPAVRVFGVRPRSLSDAFKDWGFRDPV